MVIDAHAELLRDALGIEDARLLSREPLGDGSVAGFVVAADGTEAFHYVDTSRLPVRAETGVASGDPQRPDARIWLHPADPHLPALAAAAFSHSGPILLSRLGIEQADSPELIAYRPGRRAVLRAATSDGAVWIKVVRPSRVDRIVEAHRACIEAGLPVPAVRGWSAEGLIVLDDAAGAPALDAHWEPEALLDMVDELRAGFMRVRTAPSRSGIGSRLDWYLGHAADHGGVQRLGAQVRAALEAAGPQEPVASHGDLHLGQLFLDDGRISGVIDVDTVGTSAPGEDPAAFVAHAVASALQSDDEARMRFRAVADAAAHRWAQVAGAPALTAAHLLGHAVAAVDRGEDAHVTELLRCGAAVLAGERLFATV